MASNLASLPGEITELIAGNLPPTSLCSLRLACKEINRKTFHHFGLSCFTTVRTDLTRKSLEKLQSISNEQPLRYYVQTLLVKGAGHHGHWYKACSNDFPWRRNASGSLESPIPGAHILREILVGKLVNCRSFHIIGYEDVLQPGEPDRLMHSDIIGIILAVIAETILPVKSFLINNQRIGRVDPKQLHLPLHRRPEFTSGWAHLRELTLWFSINSDDSEWVANLISRASSLRRLSLEFIYSSTSPLIESLISGHGLKGLEFFKLGCIFIAVEQIPKLLWSSRDSLRELHLYHVTLDPGGTWETLIRGLRTHFPVLDTIIFFRLGEVALEQLTCIEFPTLAENPKVPRSEQTGDSNSDCRLLQPLGLPVRLRYRKLSTQVLVVGVSYHGSNMGAFLEILAGSIERDP